MELIHKQVGDRPYVICVTKDNVSLHLASNVKYDDDDYVTQYQTTCLEARNRGINVVLLNPQPKEV